MVAAPTPLRIAFHPEDDPLEKHDHPLARQRLGDLEAGLGSAATLSFDDAGRSRPAGRPVRRRRRARERAGLIARGRRRWFTRMHGTDVRDAVDQAGVDVPSGRFFTGASRRAPRR